MANKNQLSLKLGIGEDSFIEEKSSKYWPSNDLFPLNLKLADGVRSVREVIIKDVNQSGNYLIITGFTSLNHLVSFLADDVDWNKMQQIRILLGWEPKGKPRKKWSPAVVGKEVREYWLERGLWIEQGGAVLKLTELLKNNKVEVRYSRHQHAKIYIGNENAILGSANFSGQGIISQREANIHIFKNDSGLHPDVENVRVIAENYYDEGNSYQSNLLELLKQLMRQVEWPEALARAIAELLDTQWYKNIPECVEKLNNLNLWQSQSQGLSEGLTLLQQHHCALIADPTGSGKTRMIAAIQAALLHGLWSMGVSQNLNVQVVCPPAVRINWERELRKLAVFNKTASFGIISREGSEEHKSVMESLRQTRVLIIDEAHNFLNPSYNRSSNLSKHRADYIILSTATPINRSSQDLLRILELLDLDNLTEAQLVIYREIYESAKRKKITDTDRNQITSFIQQFIVRRTKPLLRQMIQANSESYKNDNGKECAYPELKQEIFETAEDVNDKIIAQDIEGLANNLKGVLYLRYFESPKKIQLSPEDYVKRRVTLAPFLAKYLIMSRLRSSTFALKEHIIGTKQAAKDENWESFKLKETGNVLNHLKNAINNLPNTHQLPPSAFSEYTWLIDIETYNNVCKEEIRIYEEILKKAVKLSDKREYNKAVILKDLLKNHKVLIAFDNTISTLHYLNKKYFQPWNIKVSVVTGETPKLKALEDFGINSNIKSIIGLFSDALSEGVNLQKASGLVFLTIPGVIRLAEQRIGRIERLDSPHSEVTIYWPNDSDEFALKTDKKLFQAAYDVASTIGSNFHPPIDLVTRHDLSDLFTTVKAKEAQVELKKLREQEENNWQGLEDAFSPVKALYLGENKLISAEKYEEIKYSRASIKVRIGLVSSTMPWFFIATKGRLDSPPRWFFFDEQDNFHEDLSTICKLLKERLRDNGTQNVTWNDSAEILLKSYRKKLEGIRFKLLPIKRQTAIQVGEALARKQVNNMLDSELRDALKQIKGLSTNNLEEGEYYIDLYSLSHAWLDLLQDRLKTYRNKRGRKKITTLRNLLTAKNIEPFNYAEIRRFQNQIIQTTEIPFEVASCILGSPV